MLELIDQMDNSLQEVSTRERDVYCDFIHILGHSLSEVLTEVNSGVGDTRQMSNDIITHIKDVRNELQQRCNQFQKVIWSEHKKCTTLETE